MKTRKGNREGACRKIAPGKYECVVQSNFINPKTLKPKRFMRRGATEKEARTAAVMAMQAWENEYKNNGNDINFKKTKLFGEYMTEYMENKVKGTITESAYYSYYKSMERYFYPYKISKFQLHNLSVKTFQSYYDEIGKKYSKKTCALPIQLCRRLCKDLVNRSLLPEDYASQAMPKIQTPGKLFITDLESTAPVQIAEQLSDDEKQKHTIEINDKELAINNLCIKRKCVMLLL